MNARLPRPLHPAMQRGQLAYTQDGAKAQTKLLITARPGHCCFKVSTSFPCCGVNSARILLNSAVATWGEICLDAGAGVSSSSVASGNPAIAFTDD